MNSYLHKLMKYPMGIYIISIYLLIGIIVAPILIFVEYRKEKKVNPNALPPDYVVVASTIAFYPIAIFLLFFKR